MQLLVAMEEASQHLTWTWMIGMGSQTSDTIYKERMSAFSLISLTEPYLHLLITLSSSYHLTSLLSSLYPCLVGSLVSSLFLTSTCLLTHLHCIMHMNQLVSLIFQLASTCLSIINRVIVGVTTLQSYNWWRWQKMGVFCLLLRDRRR